MAERGEIRNQDYRNKIYNFANLRWGKGTPTDIEVAMEFRDKLFWFAEIKFEDTPIPTGQRILFERICNKCHDPPRSYSVVFRVCCESSVDTVEDAAFLPVTDYYWNGKWWKPHEETGLKEAVDDFRRIAGLPEEDKMPKILKLTAAQNAKRDEIAKAMIRDGADKQKAYAVSAAVEERSAGKRPKKPKKKSRRP